MSIHAAGAQTESNSYRCFVSSMEQAEEVLMEKMAELG